MGWIAQEYEGEVHIVPDTEAGHVLSRECFCEPEQDSQEENMWSHRDELDRIPDGA